MTDLHDRLESVVAKSGRSQRDISKAAGLAPGTLNDILKNRRRSPSVENLKALAGVLGVSAAWLVDGQGDNSRGFSESELSAWTAPARSGQKPDLDHTRLARLLAPDARNATTMSLNIDAPACGLVSGDIIVIDIKSPAKTGDLVVAQVADLETGEASTVLRRYLPPYLVPVETKGETYMADGVRTSVMGPVAASFRAPQLTGNR